jgi:hypothetical protein
MNISADSHLFGSRKGYECLAKSAGVTSGEDRQLSEFGFGQSTDEHFLYGLATQPTAFGRPLSSGRVAITRVMVGPLDDGGRPTLERRTMIVSAADYLAIRHDLKALIKDNVWGSSAFAGGLPIRVPTAGMSRRSAADALAWRIFDAWVIGIESRPPRGVVIAPAAAGGDQARAADAVLTLASQLADEDAVKFKWGIRLLSPIEWSDVLTLSSAGVMDGRRPVHGIGAACVKPEVQRAQAASPGMLPTVTSLQRAAIQEAVELVDDGMWDGVGGGGIIPPQGLSMKRKQPKRALIIAAIVLPIIGLTALGTVSWLIWRKPGGSAPAPATTDTVMREPAPASGSDPAAPANPAAPASGSDPAAPVTPAAPASNSEPAAPANPAAPASGANPAVPVTPAAPASGSDPAAPVTPAAPASGSDPTTPVTPAAPAEPNAPKSPLDLGASEGLINTLTDDITVNEIMKFPEYEICQKEVDALKELVGLSGLTKGGKLMFDLAGMAKKAEKADRDRQVFKNPHESLAEKEFRDKMDALKGWNHTQLSQAQKRVLNFQRAKIQDLRVSPHSFAQTKMIDMESLSKSIKDSLKKPSDLSSQERSDTMLTIMHFCLRLSISQRFDSKQSKAASAQSATLSEVKRVLDEVVAVFPSDDGAAREALNFIRPLLPSSLTSNEGLIGQGIYWEKYSMTKSDTKRFLRSSYWQTLELKGDDISCNDLFEALIDAVCPPDLRVGQVAITLNVFRTAMGYPTAKAN